MLGKAIWRLRIQENPSSAGTPPRTTLRELSAPANPLVGEEGLAVPFPRTPSPALGPSGLASPTHNSKISSDAIYGSAATQLRWDGFYSRYVHWSILTAEVKNFIKDGLDTPKILQKDKSGTVFETQCIQNSYSHCTQQMENYRLSE